MKAVLAATTIAVGLLAGQANAFCTHHDIGGTWEFYGDISSPSLSFEQALRCTVHINQLTGDIAQGSPCASSSIGGGAVTHGTVLSGNAALVSLENCTFHISVHVNAGRILEVNAPHATMSLSKEMVAGLVGVDMGGSTFTMVKIR